MLAMLENLISGFSTHCRVAAHLLERRRDYNVSLAAQVPTL